MLIRLGIQRYNFFLICANLFAKLKKNDTKKPLRVMLEAVLVIIA